MKRFVTATIRAILGGVLCSAVATGGAFAEDQPVSLTMAPAAMDLNSAIDRERVIVVATYPDGVTRDVTAEAAFTFGSQAIAELSESFEVGPIGDGETTLEAAYVGLKASITIKARDTAVTPPRSFLLDIEPVIMRAGCNSGACHGSARGKNGFHLSLFGYDPKLDHRNLTRQGRARRLTTADPEASLFLQKATTGVAHEGGMQIETGGALYEEFAQWIREGARFDEGDTPTLERVEIEPKQMVLRGSAEGRPGDSHRVAVRAFYSDGSDRDVTHLAILASMNDRSASVSEDGVVTGGARGEAPIMARYGIFAVAAETIVVPPETEFAWDEAITPNNFIDELIHEKQRRMRILPSAVCTDEVFVRRLYLDVVGLLPTRDEVEAFLTDASPNKRAELIDTLLERPEFPELWAMKWADMLRIESKSRRVSKKAMFRYSTWLRDQIVANAPMDEMVRKLLTSKGGNFANPATNFYVVEPDPKLMAEDVAQVFLGIRVQCAQCHNHPFERWTMNDYYSFSSFFAQVGRKPAEDPRETVIFNSGSGNVNHIYTGQAMPPKPLGDPAPDMTGRDRREVLADWLTAPENPWFAKSFTNRVWAHFMGQGIVDPPDDIRVSNPPSNAELFDLLGKKFIESGYDLKQVVRDICNSRTYQISTHANETNVDDTRNFSRRISRRIPAEQLLDAICQVTETPEKFAGLPLGSRAVQIADGPSGNYFLSIFGRPVRESVCTCERRDEPTLTQALHLINGSTIDARVKNGDGRLARYLSAEMEVDSIIEDLYLAAYARMPREEELAKASEFIEAAGDKRAGLEDLFWAVLNSKEFVFHH